MIDCFIPYLSASQAAETVQALKAEPLVSRVVLLSTDGNVQPNGGCAVLHIDSLTSTSAMQAIAHEATAPWTLLYTKTDTLQLNYKALQRWVAVGEDTGAGMLYADHYHLSGGKREKAPVIDYQMGSLRDDFDFGSVLLWRTATLKQAAEEASGNYQSAGLYDLRLAVSRLKPLIHVPEFLYTDVEHDTRSSGEKIFDYCDPANAESQKEMERACTAHLKAIGAYLVPTKEDGTPNFKQIDFDSEQFPVECTVVIPVLNRVRVIRDAIKSILAQEATFKYNLIVVDNHSTDGTSEAIDEFGNDPRVIHVIPDRDDLGIGGCWNLAINDPRCGKFAIGLDSDDVYATPHTLQKMVDQFYASNAAMVCGTYVVTDVNLKPIAPGVIDHHEWTPDNGRNNALHVNGFGGPRAFYTPIYRSVNLPNTSYGEDYAMGLRMSRDYRIGRVYDVMTCARRWDDNTDANLDIAKENANNHYKDKIRTWEVMARIAKNQAENE